jgi:hypothetical protein
MGTRVGLDAVEKRKFWTLPALEPRPLGPPTCSRQQRLVWKLYSHPAWWRMFSSMRNANVSRWTPSYLNLFYTLTPCIIHFVERKFWSWKQTPWMLLRNFAWTDFFMRVECRELIVRVTIPWCRCYRFKYNGRQTTEFSWTNQFIHYYKTDTTFESECTLLATDCAVEGA